MHLAIGLISLLVIALLLAEFFVVFLLPRRVKRDPAIARAILRALWVPWRALARRLPSVSADTFLGIFGPLGLLVILAALSMGVIACFAGLHWAHGERLAGHGGAGFGDDLYFSAGTFFSTSTPSLPNDGLGRALQVAEAACGFGFLAIAIGYLPALFQAFSRREIAVSQLDPRAASPPTAATLLERSGSAGGWRELDAYLHQWEEWAAELMETHLSYPVLAFFRSQHLNQNWLAALTTVVDASSYAIAYGPDEDIEGALLTFRIGRHALADLAYTLTGHGLARRTQAPPERLTPADLAELRGRLDGTALQAEDSEDARARLERLRASYEPYAFALSSHLALALPGWLPGEDVRENWRAATQRDRRSRVLP